MSDGFLAATHEYIINGFESTLQGQTSVYGDMINVISVSSFTVFILLRGYQTIAGKLSKPFEEVVWDAGRAALILTFVLNIGGWLTMSIAAINGLKDGISGSDDIWTLLDTLWLQAQTLGQTLFDKDTSTYVKLSGGLSLLLVWIGAIFTLLSATFCNILAEITIMLMTTTSPIFIFCLMYGFLRPMFNNWLQTIFTAILTIMFSALSIRLCITYLNSILKYAENNAGDNIVTTASQCLLAGIASAALIWFSSQLARALGGAAVQAIMQSSAANATRGAADMALKTGMGVSKAIPGTASAAGKGIDYAAQKGWDAYSSARMSSMLKNMSKGSTGSDIRAKRQASIDNVIKQNSRK